MLIALFGIDNDALNLFVNLLVLLLVVVWIALVAWTYFDARRRIEDPVLVVVRRRRLAVPVRRHDRLRDPAPAGVPRGPQGARPRDPRRGAARQAARGAVVPELRLPGRANYLRCPECQTRIKDPCESCEKPIDPRWTMCPYCETPSAASSRAGARRSGVPGARSATARRPSATDSRSASALSARRHGAAEARGAQAREAARAPSPHAARPRAPRRGRPSGARSTKGSNPPAATPTPLRSTPRPATARATGAPGPHPRAEPRRSIVQCPGR